MKKFYARLGLSHSEKTKEVWVIYSPDGRVFCSFLGKDKAVKLRNYLNKEFL